MGSLTPLLTPDLPLSGPPSGLSSQASEKSSVSCLSTVLSGPPHPFCCLSPALPSVGFATMPLQMAALSPGSSAGVM